MEYNNYLGWIYPKTQDLVNTQDVENIIYLQKGNNGGLASLDGSGKIPTSQLPSYVDDVLEFENKNSFPEEGEEGKIYVDIETNYTYRWTGSTYILIGGLQNLKDGRSNGSIMHIYATAEDGNYSLGTSASALGYNTKASGNYSHAEGGGTTASGVSSHAEGYYTQATNTSAHAEGNNTIASGASSHAEGNQTTASGLYSHASGIGTTAQHQSQTVIGEYNKLDTQGTLSTRGKYVFIVGNGTGTNNRSNALAVTWDGNVLAAGTPSAANHLATKSYVDTNIIDLESLIQTLGASISSPIVCFTYDITNGQTPSIDFSYADIESAMSQSKIVFIVYKLIVTGDSFTNQNISQTRVTECNVYTTEGTPSYRVYTEDSQMQFIASSETLFMTRASSSQIDPDPADRDPNDFT